MTSIKYKYIFGNWKLNKTNNEIIDYFHFLNNYLKKNKKLSSCKSLICGLAPTFLGLSIATSLKDKKINIIAQDVCDAEGGSYTGQIGCKQLKDLHIKYTIIGHSETRKYLNVDDKIVNKKLITCFKNKIIPIVCIGEPIYYYKNNQTKKFLLNQLKTIFCNVNNVSMQKWIIAYEPLWAIGTGKTPSLLEIENICKFIKGSIKKILNSSPLSQIPILYGGSVNEINATSISNQKDVDGLLIGAASLDVYKFIKILESIVNEK